VIPDQFYDAVPSEVQPKKLEKFQKRARNPAAENPIQDPFNDAEFRKNYGR